jgi:hypothetical protein
MDVSKTTKGAGLSYFNEFVLLEIRKTSFGSIVEG